MHIFLIGFMGAGKSTLGRAAAQALSWPFLDLDDLIEAQQKCSIRQIFAEEGEPYFRRLEREALAFVIGLEEPHIVATGGGTPCQGDNMQRLKRGGLTLYLRPSPEVITQRLRQMRAERPKLREIPDHQLGEFILRLLEEREPYYRQAHHILTDEQLTAAHIADLAQQQSGPE